MNETLTELKSRIVSWAEKACHLGLVSSSTVETLASLSEQTPANLFDRNERPLVVGFFGGTGVGKSTLLNRLAGESIARTGVERPTSREVTLYLHDSVSIDHLPADFPLDKIHTATHGNDENRHILWIDMPDFDSSESANREQVHNWLPHIDLLIYVVSPERYKDDNGWRLLLEHGQRHAWCFVINHWDKGSDVQRQDFTRMLAEAGLDKPLLFCTDSSGSQSDTAHRPDNAENTDDLGALKTTVQSLADRNTIRQLEVRGISVRAGEMKHEVETAIEGMGSDENHQALEQYWTAQWQEVCSAIKAALQWKIDTIAAGYKQPEAGLIGSAFRLLGRRGSNPATGTDHTETESLSADAGSINDTLFESDIMSRMQDSLAGLVQQAPQNGVPAASVRTALGTRQSVDDSALNQTVQEHLQIALNSPGSSVQRILHKLFAVLASVLPALAMAWAGYRIVTAFHAGGATPAAYLSSNFAINALLLLALAWALPYFLYRKTKPSRVTAARKGLREGLNHSLTHFGDQVSEALRKLRAEKDQLQDNGRALFHAFPAPTANPEPSADKPLSRALLNQRGTESSVH
ncbi:MAG: 50S ribosome-binding GTPase [Granulosicoccus sp.]|nr:50S ribosome-binding GTPase [Granulosicoccus sp.]